jgi:hypothetical protein
VIRTEGFGGLFAKAQGLLGMAVAAELDALVRKGAINKLEEMRKHLRHLETATRSMEGAIRTEPPPGSMFRFLALRKNLTEPAILLGFCGRGLPELLRALGAVSAPSSMLIGLQ